MSEQDPKRLLEGGGSSGELRSLLEAGRSEVPDNARLAMLAVKMGIVGGLGGAGAAGAAGAGGAGAGGAGGGAAGGASAAGGAKAVATAGAAVKAGMAVKVIGAIAVASVAGAGAVVVAKHQVETAQKPAGMVAMASAGASAGAGAKANESANANEASAEPSSDADAGSAVTPPVTAKTASRTAPVNTASAEAKDEGPEAEVKLVQRAQDALRGSRPAEALALCNDHAKRFPNGMVTQECEVIAVEALVKTGHKDEARRRADRFKARFPGSAAIRRLDVLLGD